MTREWHEDDRFWNEFAPLVMFGENRRRAAAIEANLLTFMLSPGAVLLDMCCGLGRHSIELAKLGFRVTGVDRTFNYLQKAKRSARKHEVALDLVQGDMRTFRTRQAFDAVLCLATSFGFFVRQSEDALVAENFRASLRPGGRLIMDMIGKEILARDFIERDCRELGANLYVGVERRVCEDWSWVEELWTVSRDGESYQYQMAYRPYSAIELSSLLLAAGFSQIKVYGGLGREAYDQNARRLVIDAAVEP